MIHIVDSICSTNDWLAKYHFEVDDTVLAIEQTQGKGRRGNTWESKIGGFYISTVSSNHKLLPFVVGISIMKVLEAYSSDLNLKWPNDILYKNKKVGGILVEKEHYENKIKTIIGIGINLSLKNKKSWWGDLSEFNLQDQRNDLIVEIINNLIKAFDEKDNDWKEEWLNSCMHINQKIEIYDDKRKKNAIFVGIDDLGNALIETDNGIEVYKSGQISIKGIY